MSVTETVSRTEWFDIDDVGHEEAVGQVGTALRESYDVEEVDSVNVDRSGDGQWVVSVRSKINPAEADR